MFTSKGKLYNNEERFVADVDYRLINGSSANVWGELIPTVDRNLNAGSGYVLELENNRKINCGLKVRLCSALTIPNSSVYRFIATYPAYVD
ncbi:hypothetical protein ACFLYV_04285 [Chloroflexota bacterium]